MSHVTTNRAAEKGEVFPGETERSVQTSCKLANYFCTHPKRLQSSFTCVRKKAN